MTEPLDVSPLGDGSLRPRVDGDYFIAKIAGLAGVNLNLESELRSQLPQEIGDGRGLVNLVQAYAERMPGASQDDAFKAADVAAWKLANDLREGWTPGSVKQHGSGWRFRAREIKLDDDRPEEIG